MPFDVRCRKLCVEDEECGIAHIYAATFAYHDLANRNPPPPNPPLPPSTPPPQDPPFAPLPPAPPPEERRGYRVWGPSALAVPVKDEELDEYAVTCTTESCHGPVTVWSSPAGYEAQMMSQQLLGNSVFLNSLCPYECTRTARWNGMDEQGESFVIDGVGLVDATISYPGYAEDPDYGMWSYERASTDVASFSGLATPIHKSEGLTLDECRSQFVSRRNTAPHAVWLYRNVSSFGTRTGQCIYYLVAASQLQQGVWRGFFKHASHTLSLTHFSSVNVVEIRASVSSANRNVDCDGEKSKVCVFWSEFDLDGQSELGCFPNVEGTNVVSPTELLADLRRSGISYPPPSPPPPFPPEPPPAPTPPPNDFVCSINSLPDAQFVKDHSYSAPAPPPGVGKNNTWLPTSRESRSVPCWRWDENLLWPPRQAHHDVFESQYQCAGESSLSIQWTTSFRQSKLDERFLMNNNADTCPSANDGICDDGGEGDVGRRTTPITLIGGGVKVTTLSGEKCKAPGVANEVTLTVQEYTVMRIEPQFDSHQLPAVGDRIFLFPDATSGDTQTVSRNRCFDSNRPIGPLEVTEVHNEDCDKKEPRGDGVSTCFCGGDLTIDSDFCHGHDSTERINGNDFETGYVPINPLSGFPRRTSFFKARNIYDRNCKSVTKTIQDDNLCEEMDADYMDNRMPCVQSPSLVQPSDIANYFLKQYCDAGTTSVVNDGFSCIESNYPASDGQHQFYQNRNKNVNFHFGNYQCGMRERVLVFGPTGSYCPYGQDRSDCGNREDVVSFGKSSANNCRVTLDTQETTFGYPVINDLYMPLIQDGANFRGWRLGDNFIPSAAWAMNADASNDGTCNARGNSMHLVRTCPFGMDSGDCGHQTLTLPRSKIPDREPDNSCVTANNGLCEDQLFFSEVAPNDVKLHHLGVCLPNTECVLHNDVLKLMWCVCDCV